MSDAEGTMMTMTPAGTMPQVCPYLYYQDVEQAIAWLTRSYGFRLRQCRRIADGSIMHAELELGSGVVYLGPAMAQFGTRAVDRQLGVHASLYVFVDDIDRHCAVATAAGATISAPIVDTPWGDRMYTTRDLEGQRWIFAQHVRDVTLATPQPTVGSP
jgi:uncharacterized glyoxalase superfamily protein PhnB